MAHGSKREDKVARWQRHLRQWRKSGLTQAAFCRQERLAYHQFVWWKRRLESCVEEHGTFVPVHVLRPAASEHEEVNWQCELLTPFGLRIRLRRQPVGEELIALLAKGGA